MVAKVEKREPEYLMMAFGDGNKEMSTRIFFDSCGKKNIKKVSWIVQLDLVFKLYIINIFDSCARLC